MKFYELVNTVKGGRRQVAIESHEKKRVGLTDVRSAFESFLDIDSKFELKLWFSDFQRRELEDPGFGSLHVWRGNILLDPPLSGGPWGFFMIIDAKLKDIISSFMLPAHRFYPVIIENVDDHELREYFLFQLTSDKYKELYYPKSSFVVLKDDAVIETIEPGVIKNYEEYDNRLGLEIQKDQRSTLRAKDIVFRKYFEVTWGDSGEILFSERLKDAIEKTGLKEAFFKVYDDNVEFKEPLL